MVCFAVKTTIKMYGIVAIVVSEIHFFFRWKLILLFFSVDIHLYSNSCVIIIIILSVMLCFIIFLP